MAARKRKRRPEEFRSQLRARLADLFQLDEDEAGKVCDESLVGLVYLHNAAHEAHEAQDLQQLDAIRETLQLFSEEFEFDSLSLMVGGLANENAQRRLCCLTGMEVLLKNIGLGEVTLETSVRKGGS